MTDKKEATNKLILVHYLNFGTKSFQKKQEDMVRYMDMIKSNGDTDDVTHYILGIEEGNSYIDCINPKLVSEVEYSESVKKLNEYMSNLDEILK